MTSHWCTSTLLFISVWNLMLSRLYAVSVIPLNLWRCLPAGAQKVKLLCHMHGFYGIGSNPLALQRRYQFYAVGNSSGCPWKSIANCTQSATGESLNFCYETKTTPDSTPFFCKPLWSQTGRTPSNTPSDSLLGAGRCRVALVSSAVWGTTMPLPVIIVIGTQTPPLPGEELQLSLITPAGKNITRFLINWDLLNWTLAGHDLTQQGPPDWVVPLKGHTL